MESKLKHLEFIQTTIGRFNSNSFLIKGWAITLVSALFALAAKDANQLYVFIVYISVPSFWILDAYYLSLERQYRDLYAKVRQQEAEAIDFSMDASMFCIGRNTWLSCLITRAMLFYGLLASLPILLLLIFQP
ncbi:MAG: hypothetical protein EOO61_13615 [Hymenobacter sp.]|nr:MAG: hypothetical protein EOO61_13615 [Hymenobacter sp.]